VEGARTHCGGGLGALVIEADAPAHVPPLDQLERGGDLIREPRLLVRVDADQAERSDELLQMLARRRHDQRRAVGTEHAGDLRRVARGEHVEHGGGYAVAQR
jgi:hypothetical protein